jgi:hypothetical protein
MFFRGMPQPSHAGSRGGNIFCSEVQPGCRQMVVVSDLGKALAAKKIIVAAQIWRTSDGRWMCDRCAAGWSSREA